MADAFAHQPPLYLLAHRKERLVAPRRYSNPCDADRNRPYRSTRRYRLEYCVALRALRKPTFFRSTARASRVKKPDLRSV